MRVVNRRALKVCKLCEEGQIQFSKNRKEDGIQKFKSALEHAKKLQSKRKYYVVFCRLNLAIAYLHTWKWAKGVNILKGIVPYAEENQPSILEDIWYYIGVGLKKSANGEEAYSREKRNEIKGAFEKSKHYADSEAQNDVISKYIDSTLKNLANLETVTEKRRDLLARRIDLKQTPEEPCIVQKVELVRLMLMEDPVEAISIVKEQLNIETLFPNEEAKQGVDPSTWCDLGLLFTEVRAYGIAKQCFRYRLDNRTNMKAEDSFLLRHNIAAIYMLEDDYQNAIEQYEEAIETFEGHPGTLDALDRHVHIRNKAFVTHVYLNLAYSYLRLRESTKAYRYYQKVLDLKTDDVQEYIIALEGIMAAVLLKRKSTKSLERFKLELGLLACMLVGSREEIQQRLLDIRAKVQEMNVEHNNSNAGNENKRDTEEEDRKPNETLSTTEEGNGREEKAKETVKQLIAE